MATDRFFIAPYDQKSGLQTNVKPWLIPDEAFSDLSNAYVFRGRVRKRFGSRLLDNNPLASRLRVNIGTTDGSGNISGSIPLNASSEPIITPAIGQLFSVGAQLFTVYQDGTMLISGTATIATFDFTSGAVVINGADINTALYYYPSLPVMGLLTYEQAAINDETTIAFDTRFAYQYNDGWDRLSGEATAGAASWTGDDSQFFWGTTWTGVNAADRVFFVTNNNEAEPLFLRYFFNNQWTSFNPLVNATERLFGCRLILPFKNRLLAFGTLEGTDLGSAILYANRVRACQVGSPLETDAWQTNISGKGFGLDASTTEAIITAEFIKDRLIVYFERSTYELVYTGNQVYPYTWQLINTELGAESTFSVVPFDKVALGIGNVAIVACNGANVERIDTSIPQFVFDIHNTESGIERVYGIRDYFVEMVYWTVPDTLSSDTFPYPNQVLVYNYRNGTWALNDDSITAFGYFQPITGITWGSETVTWGDEIAWGSGDAQSRFQAVIGGNQEGFTFLCDANATTNASAIQITNLVISGTIATVTAINHNFRAEDYIYLEGITGSGSLSLLLNDTIVQVLGTAITANSFTFLAIASGTYTGGGLISRVSQISITTKEYNFYGDQGRNAYIPKVDFMVDSTPSGQIQANFFVSTSSVPLLQDSAASGVLLGTGTLDYFPYTTSASPVIFEANASRLWHPVYFQADGEVVQFQLIMNDTQMRDINIRSCDFALHAMCIYAQPTSYRFQ